MGLILKEKLIFVERGSCFAHLKILRDKQQAYMYRRLIKLPPTSLKTEAHLLVIPDSQVL